MFLTFSCIFSASKQIYHQLQQNQNSSKPKFSIPNKKKKIIKSEISLGQKTTKQEPPMPLEEDWPRASRSAVRWDDLGFDEWCFSGSRRSVTNGFDDGRARRSEEWVRRMSLTIWGIGSTDELDDLRNGFAIWRFGHCSTNELGLGFSGFIGALGCESISPSPVLGCWCDLSSVLSLSLSLLFSWGGSDLKWKWERKLFSAPLNLILRSNWNHFQFDRIFSNSQTFPFPENHFWNQFEVDSNTALELEILVIRVCKI